MSSFIERAANLLRGTKQEDITLFKLLKDLWENSENRGDYVREMFAYYEGNLTKKLSSNIYFPDQTRSNDNVIEPIVETKVSNLLDAQFTTAVVPDIGAFYDMEAIKECQAVADILNNEVENVFKRNKADMVDEEVARAGEICGFGGAQVEWTTRERPDGDVKIKHIMSDKIRWNKKAKQGHVSMIAYEEELNPSEAKDLYCKDENGEYITELCEIIDKI